MNDDLIEALKILADKRMETSLNSMYYGDDTYKKMEEKAIAIESVYDSLDLDQGVRDTVDNLLAERDGINAEKVSLAYWAGMMDAIFILRELEIISA